MHSLLFIFYLDFAPCLPTRSQGKHQSEGKHPSNGNTTLSFTLLFFTGVFEWDVINTYFCLYCGVKGYGLLEVAWRPLTIYCINLDKNTFFVYARLGQEGHQKRSVDFAITIITLRLPGLHAGPGELRNTKADDG